MVFDWKRLIGFGILTYIIPTTIYTIIEKTFPTIESTIWPYLGSLLLLSCLLLFVVLYLQQNPDTTIKESAILATIWFIITLIFSLIYVSTMQTIVLSSHPYIVIIPYLTIFLIPTSITYIKEKIGMGSI